MRQWFKNQRRFHLVSTSFDVLHSRTYIEQEKCVQKMFTQQSSDDENVKGCSKKSIKASLQLKRLGKIEIAWSIKPDQIDNSSDPVATINQIKSMYYLYDPDCLICCLFVVVLHKKSLFCMQWSLNLSVQLKRKEKKHGTASCQHKLAAACSRWRCCKLRENKGRWSLCPVSIYKDNWPMTAQSHNSLLISSTVIIPQTLSEM